jgi:hypothetical protein
MSVGCGEGCEVLFAAGARSKHARGGARKLDPRRREGEPQRGEGQEGRLVLARKRKRLAIPEGIKPSKSCAPAELWRETAGEDRLRRRGRIFGRESPEGESSGVLPGRNKPGTSEGWPVRHGSLRA